MPRELGVPKYWKYSELEVGTKLVDKGEYVGTTQGKFGDQYNFIQIEDHQHVVLNKAGAIAWRIEQGHISEGDVVDITFEGKSEITSGDFVGKEANNFGFAVYDDKELPEEFKKRKGAKAADVPASPAPTAVSEAMDELE